jgi:hypothetical protein
LQPPVFLTSAAMGKRAPLADAPRLVTSVGGVSSVGAAPASLAITSATYSVAETCFLFPKGGATHRMRIRMWPQLSRELRGNVKIGHSSPGELRGKRVSLLHRGKYCVPMIRVIVQPILHSPNAYAADQAGRAKDIR